MTKAETMWTGKTVLVTGGSSFIGSTLADQLIERGAKVRVVDDLTSGHLGNIAGHIAAGNIEFIRADLREPGIARGAMQGIQTVFHLAADHGGRGYVDLHQAGPASNFFLDGLIFWEAVKAKVDKGRLRLVRLRLSQLSAVRREQGSLPDRGSDQGSQRRRQYLRLGQADGRIHAAGLLQGAWPEGGFLPVLHRVRPARRGKSCRHRHDCPRVSQAESVRGLGRRHADSQLDLHRRHRLRHHRWPAKKSTTARPSIWAPWSASR